MKYLISVLISLALFLVFRRDHDYTLKTWLYLLIMHSPIPAAMFTIERAKGVRIHPLACFLCTWIGGLIRLNTPRQWQTIRSWIIFPMHLSDMPTARPRSAFLSPKLRRKRLRPTNSQISLKPKGDVFVAGRDSAQQLLALCHAAVSDPW
jgi:hypothetical protein